MKKFSMILNAAMLALCVCLALLLNTKMKKVSTLEEELKKSRTETERQAQLAMMEATQAREAGDMLLKVMEQAVEQAELCEKETIRLMEQLQNCKAGKP